MTDAADAPDHELVEGEGAAAPRSISVGGTPVVTDPMSGTPQTLRAMPLLVPLSRAVQVRHLPGLDGLRAIAVFTVIAFHFGFMTIPGDLGVSAFFVLSGFLITTLLEREWDANGCVSLRDFYARRTLRIFPAYYTFILFSLTVDTLLHQRWLPGLLPSAFTYLVNYFNATHNHPDTSVAHAWSLAVEEQFYLLWPVVFILLRRRGEAALLRGLAAIILIVLVWRSYLYLARDVGSAWVYNAFDTRFDNLAIGCMLAILIRRKALSARAETLARAQWLPLLTLVALWVSRARISNAYHYSVGFTVDAVLVAVFIAQILQLHARLLWRWLEHPIVKYLGTISYPLYLYHAWGLAVPRHLGPLSLPIQFVVGVLASVVFASVSYFVVERPFLALKRRFEVTSGRARARASSSEPSRGVDA